MHKFLLIVLTSFCLAANSFSQNSPDTIDTGDDWEDWEDWEEENNHDWDMDFDLFEFAGAPTLSANYGLYKLTHKDLNGNFAEPRAFQLKLGHSDSKQVWQSENILTSKFKYIAISNITTDLANIAADDPDYETNSWKIAVGKTEGYGYKLGPTALFLISGNTIDWTKLKMSAAPADSFDNELTDLYNNTFRFGTSFEAGIRYQIVPQISIEADYERSVVFPRHLFWKWVGSAAIENIGQFLIDRFVDNILDSSPYFAPAISFLLKNGLNFGIYELRKDKMNWPFKSVPPLMYEQYKFGLTFTL